MHNVDLPGIDDGFPIKAHQMDGFHIPAESLHVVQIRIYGIEALYARRPGRNYKILAGSHQFDSGSRDMGLQILGIISP